MLFGPALIKKISSYQSIGQPIREDGPESHIIAKKGTPTMGGIIILLSIVGSILLWVNPESYISWPVIFILVSFGLIGFTDDFSKVKNLEENETFYEGVLDAKTGKRKTFFNLGPSNNLRRLLDDKIKIKLEKAFEKEMVELEYL